MKRLSAAFGELCPNVAPNEVVGTTSKEAGRLLVHVGVTPILVQSHKGVADTVENVRKLLHGSLTSVARRSGDAACGG